MSEQPPPGGQPQYGYPAVPQQKKKGPSTLIILLIVFGIMLCGGLGILAILAAIAVPNFLEAQTRSRVSRSKADLRTMATALESYYVDNNAYPPSQFDHNISVKVTAEAGGPGVRSSLAPYQGTFHTLTTPIAYITYIFPDPFGDSEEQTYSYYSDGEGWIAWSLGPDADLDVSPDLYDGEKSMEENTEALILDLYDPTNGTVSNGDVVRMKN